MPCTIASGTVKAFTVPLIEPFATALGRKTATTNVAIELHLKGGAQGRGEASSSIVMAHQKPALLTRTLKAMLKEYRGMDVRALAPLVGNLWKRWGKVPAAAAAFESAATAALCAHHRMRLCDYFGGARDEIMTDITLSASDVATTERAAALWAKRGFRDLKVKVGSGGMRADLDRVLAADRAGRDQGRRPRLALDGNQKLGTHGALRLVDACLAKGVRISLLEQPVARTNLKAMRTITQRSPVPVAADESLRTVEDARRILDLGAAHILNVKVGKSGLTACRRIIALAQAAQAQLMIGCMQESALGLSPSVHLACGSGAFTHHDLDSDLLLSSTQPKGGFKRRGAQLKI
jgi:L-alanine-DL-glutamate epimerase-like enolase superfamily enzyme